MCHPEKIVLSIRVPSEIETDHKDKREISDASNESHIYTDITQSPQDETDSDISNIDNLEFY